MPGEFVLPEGEAAITAATPISAPPAARRKGLRISEVRAKNATPSHKLIQISDPADNFLAGLAAPFVNSIRYTLDG